MLPDWHRGLRTGLQYVVREPDDIEVEAGDVKVGDLRPRAFSQLQKTLTDEQILAMGWTALADIAVWPQLAIPDARALADSIVAVSPTPPLQATRARSLTSATHNATTVILTFIAKAQVRLKHPLHAPAVDFEALRIAINTIAHYRKDPIAYWRQWLRRVIETAAVTSPEEACALALEALRSTLIAPARFEYEAMRTAASPKPNTNGPFEVAVVQPRKGGRVVGRVGVFSDLDPAKRKIAAKFLPDMVVDRYRMAYLLRSVCMGELLDDEKSGFFDSVTCTNVQSGETWSYTRI
ncbi:MAG: hypothetical protein ACOY0T_28920 [Myxococcota bacterium]